MVELARVPVISQCRSWGRVGWLSRKIPIRAPNTQPGKERLSRKVPFSVPVECLETVVEPQGSHQLQPKEEAEEKKPLLFCICLEFGEVREGRGRGERRFGGKRYQSGFLFGLFEYLLVWFVFRFWVWDSGVLQMNSRIDP
ncbi:uncharacterized protein TrAFT101_010648 [Trichoderma asperellum]|uniref:uncharacterized protein n=1 Tax=Trichoderma asperellum TaxID=101201 RepID=UPI003329D919|nr:hypothetical protein TrAFT101_010648 [Trichoderma asperellum]